LEGMNWINLVQNRVKWRAFINTTLNFGFHNMWGISWLVQRLLVSQEGIY
jgi:hypothetical protein